MVPNADTGPTLHTRRHDQQKELQRAKTEPFSFQSLECIPNIYSPRFHAGPRAPPPTRPVFLKHDKKKKKLHECSQDEPNGHKTAFRCGWGSPLLLGEEKGKNVLKHFPNYDRSWSNFSVAFIFFFITFRKELDNIIIRHNCCYV